MADEGGGPSSFSSGKARTTSVTNDDPSTDVHQALLTEHFGFHPRVFVDALVYAANEHLYSIGGQFEEFAKKQLKAACRRAAKRERERERGGAGSGTTTGGTSKLAKMTSTQIEAEAERGVHAVLTLLENALDHIFDLLELYCLKAVFGVRPSQARALTLKHHRGLDLRSAEERAANGEPLTAERENEELVQRELELRRKIERANEKKHSLCMANMAAEQSVLRARRVSDAFAALVGQDDGEGMGGAPLTSTTPQYARKLRADAQTLVLALERLSQTDPLGASLTTTFEEPSSARKDKREVMEASGATEKDKRAWERGREAYINWEMDRIIRSVRSRAAAVQANETAMLADVTAGNGGVGSSTMMFDTTAIKGLSSSTYAPSGGGGGAKRRRTTAGRQSTVGERTESEHQAAQIGQVGDVEALADVLRRKGRK